MKHPVIVAVMLIAVIQLQPALCDVKDTPMGCRDASGNLVDWYVMYKFPRLHDSADGNIASGLGYMYATSTQGSNGSATDRWHLSDLRISSNQSLPGVTLAPLYQNPDRKSLIYVFYNDEHPDGPTSFTQGHTKGVAAFEGDLGFWLIHSVPHYPPAPGQAGYGYPESGEHYGQSFLCLTLGAQQVETVATQLLLNEPYIYASQLSAQLTKKYPILEQVINGQVRSQPPWFNVEQLTTSSGNTFTSYAKGRHFSKDLYADLVAPALLSSLLTETWMNGPHKEQMPSECRREFTVKNVEGIAVHRLQGDLDPAGLQFHSSQDHSKWAVSDSIDRPWVCVGDINRMTTQEVRGGGTVCRRDTRLWTLYSQLVSLVQPCPGQARPRFYDRRP